jgi:hypothetical protein
MRIDGSGAALKSRQKHRSAVRVNGLACVLFSGYLPDCAHDLDTADTSVSFEKLRDFSRIHDTMAKPDADPLFSAKFEGTPAPL